jgi:hypothetical protein
VRAWFRSAGFTIERLGRQRERICYLASVVAGPPPIFVRDWPQVYRPFGFASGPNPNDAP